MFISKKSFLASSIILFIGLLWLATYTESAISLYVASALPVAIVISMPDRGPNQYIRPNSKSSVRFIKQTIGGDPMLAILFKPGVIHWTPKGRLYFHLSSIGQSSETAGAEVPPNSQRIDMVLSVLPFDLLAHPRKQGWIGINLAQVAERTHNLSFTTAEVSRLLIRISDLEESALKLTAMTNTTTTSRGGKRLQA